MPEATQGCDGLNVGAADEAEDDYTEQGPWQMA